MPFRYWTFNPADNAARPGSPLGVFSFPSPESPRLCCTICLGSSQQRKPSRLRIEDAKELLNRKTDNAVRSTAGLMGRQKLEVGDNSSEKHFTVFAKDLLICWGDTPSYWQWIKGEEPSGTNSHKEIELAELQRVCWLEIRGKCEMWELLPETAYEVIFVILMRETSYGWDVPVNLELVLPDGTKRRGKINLDKQPRGRWLEIPAGELRTPTSENSGTIEFSMDECKQLHWKSGLVVKGVRIQPKK